MAFNVDRIQELLYDHEIFGESVPLQDYKSVATDISDQIGFMEDPFQLEELIYDLCSRTGSEDYEDVANRIWDDFIAEEG